MRQKTILVLFITGAVLSTAGLILSLIAGGPKIKEGLNKYEEAMTKADLNTDYKTLLETESSLRAYRASYDADKILYEVNILANDESARITANAAMSRANMTAANYNQLLKSLKIKEIPLPEDLLEELPYIN